MAQLYVDLMWQKQPLIYCILGRTNWMISCTIGPFSQASVIVGKALIVALFYSSAPISHDSGTLDTRTLKRKQLNGKPYISKYLYSASANFSITGSFIYRALHQHVYTLTGCFFLHKQILFKSITSKSHGSLQRGKEAAPLLSTGLV